MNPQWITQVLMKKILIGFMALLSVFMLTGCSAFGQRDTTPLKECLVALDDDDDQSTCDADRQKTILDEYVKSFGLRFTSQGDVEGSIQVHHSNQQTAFFVDIMVEEEYHDDLTQKQALRYRDIMYEIVEDFKSIDGDFLIDLALQIDGRDNSYRTLFGYNDLNEIQVEFAIHYQEDEIDEEILEEAVDRFLPLMHEEHLTRMVLALVDSESNYNASVTIDAVNHVYAIIVDDRFDVSLDAVKMLIESELDGFTWFD